MPSFQDFSLIKKEIEFIKDRNEIDTISTAFEFAILEKLYPNIDLDENITDGGQDFCLDAYIIDDEEEEINIFQFKHTDNFNTSKTKEAFKDKDLSDIILKFERIWDKDEKLLTEANEKSAEAIREIWEALDKGITKTNIWLVSNYYQTIADQSKINHIEKELHNKFRARAKILSLDNLVELSLQKEFRPVNLQLQLKGRNYFEDSAGGVRALIGEINAFNFVESIMDEEGGLKEEVFNENVRVYLRRHTKINKQIYSSIESDEDYKFFFYNNGITAVCDSYDHPNTDGPIVKLENFQIVNGGQTMHSLYEAYKNNLEENLKNIYLLLRIYEVKNREIGQAIARYTNTQNPVRSRDIMSNDSIQIKLQKELKNFGWWYERKRYEFREKGVNNNEKIDAERLGQVILSFYLEKPGSAKNKKQGIFGDFYNTIFSEEKISASYILPPYLLSKNIEKDIKDFSRSIRKLRGEGKIKKLENALEKNEFLVHAHYYLLFTLKILADKEGLKIEQGNVDEIFSLYDDAKDILRKIVKKKLKSDTLLSLPRLFKSDDLVEEIKSVILR